MTRSSASSAGPCGIGAVAHPVDQRLLDLDDGALLDPRSASTSCIVKPRPEPADQHRARVVDQRERGRRPARARCWSRRCPSRRRRWPAAPATSARRRSRRSRSTSSPRSDSARAISTYSCSMRPSSGPGATSYEWWTRWPLRMTSCGRGGGPASRTTTRGPDERCPQRAARVPAHRGRTVPWTHAAPPADDLRHAARSSSPPTRAAWLRGPSSTPWVSPAGRSRPRPGRRWQPVGDQCVCLHTGPSGARALLGGGVPGRAAGLPRRCVGAGCRGLDGSPWSACGSRCRGAPGSGGPRLYDIRQTRRWSADDVVRRDPAHAPGCGRRPGGAAGPARTGRRRSC